MMQKLALAALVALALVSSSAGSGCLSACKVNSHCTSSNCTSCLSGLCGAGCSASCDVDSQCLDPNCPYCYHGRCGNSPHSPCGGNCTHDFDCEQTGDCTTCYRGKCEALCGSKCASNAECGGPTCKKCLQGVCHQDNQPCGGPCSANLDCNQASYCSMCVAGKCTAGCGQPCVADDECRDATCKFCKTFPNGSKKCSTDKGSAKCHQTCTSNSDCTGSPGTCEFCQVTNGSYACGSPCGQKCLQASDCVTPGCGACTGGKCGPN